MTTSQPSISVVIPTFGRHEVLVDSIRFVLPLLHEGDEFLVIDQTPNHPQAVTDALAEWDASGKIRWLKQAPPSIPDAMNRGLKEARGDVVVFLDDDIRPDSDLLAAYRRVHQQTPGRLVAGRVLQPWHRGSLDPPGAPFGFNCPDAREVAEFIGCNVSVPRAKALALGGFDRNFVRVAYRFEADFAWRWCQAGHSIHYAPDALVHHLKAPSGGTRSYGEHLKNFGPSHSVGEYYFLAVNRPPGWLRRWLRRPFREVATRHHLRRPWWIPATAIAECSGMVWAIALLIRGRRLLAIPAGDADVHGGSASTKHRPNS